MIDETRGGRDLCIFQIDLFSAQELVLKTILKAAEHEKEIRVSNSTRMQTSSAQATQRLRRAAKDLFAKLPAELRGNPHAQVLVEKCGGGGQCHGDAPQQAPYCARLPVKGP